MIRRHAVSWSLALVVSAGLAVDAGVHAALAPDRPPNGALSQIDLFYLEAAVASVTLLLVVVFRNRVAYGIAGLVAASSLGTVVLYRYVDVGALGPLPDMYEPFWYLSKVLTTIAEAVTVAAASAGLVVSPRRSSRRSDLSQGRTHS